MVKEVGKKVEKLLLLYEHLIDQVCEVNKKLTRKCALSNKHKVVGIIKGYVLPDFRQSIQYLQAVFPWL